MAESLKSNSHNENSFWKDELDIILLFILIVLLLILHAWVVPASDVVGRILDMGCGAFFGVLSRGTIKTIKGSGK